MNPVFRIGDDILGAQESVPHRQTLPFGREALHAAVLAIRDDHAPVAEDADAMRRQEGAGRRSDRAPACDQAAAGVEAVDAAIAVAVRDVEAAIGREGDIAGVVEGMAGPVALADLPLHPAFGTAEEDAVGVAVDDGKAAIGRRRDLVGVEAERLAPAAHEAAICCQRDDARPIWLDRAVAAQQDMDEPVPADREIGDPAGCCGQGPPGTFDAVEPVAKRDAQFRFHSDLVVVARAAGCRFTAPAAWRETP